MFDFTKFIQALFGAHQAQQNPQQPVQNQSMPVGTMDTSRAGYGVPDASGGLISPILQGGVQHQGSDFVQAAAPGQAFPQGGAGMVQGNGMSYGATDHLQPANPNRGNDLNSSAPSGMPISLQDIQNMYASIFGKKKR